MATIPLLKPGAKKPEVFRLSTTTLPEKIIVSVLSAFRYSGKASGSSCQVFRSGLTAWAQLMWPQVSPSGLYW